ncbi:10141_t:CDS:2, partial [Scutellospora calospora]
MDAVGREFALKDDNLKITNTKCYCANYLRDCPYFATKYSFEQIQLILNSATLSSPNKQIIISYTDEEDKDENDSTSEIISSNSLASSNTLKKQTTLSKYVSRSLTASEIHKFERLVLQATVSARFAFCNHILTSITDKVQVTIKDLACKDKIGIIIAFDS